MMMTLGMSAAQADHNPRPVKRDAPPALGQIITEPFAWCDKNGACNCFMPLGCTGDKCSTIQSHLDNIHKILAGKKRGTTLACEYIEEGTCGTWRYIYCDQGQPGTQLRFFDENGYVAASYFISDYGEFCDGLARVQYMGQIPTCQPLVTKKVLYGKGHTPIAPASRNWPGAAALGQPAKK